MLNEIADVFKRGIAAGIGGGILTNLGKKYGMENLNIALLALEKNKKKVKSSGAWVSWFLKTMKSDHKTSPICKKKAIDSAKTIEDKQQNVNEIFSRAYATTDENIRAQLIAKLPQKYQEIIQKNNLLNQ